MTAAELRERAQREADELGLPPDDPTDRPLWIEERRGAVELLAALAGYDQALLRQATIAPADGPLSAEARDLLIEASGIHR